MKYILITSIVIFFSACSSTKNKQVSCPELTPKFEPLPEYKTMVLDEEKLVSIEIKEECGGIYGIQKIPDGWNFSAIAKGENYMITITPPETHNSVKNFHGSPELSTIFRGEWSDCYNLSVVVNAEKNKKPIKRKFKKDFGIGPWVEY